LYGALLAEQGFTGITDIFENPYGGFCTTFSRSTDRFDQTQLTADLGARYETTRISVKLYACVSTNHTSLDALRKIRERRPFGPEEVASITVHCSRATLEHAGWPYRPEGITAAQLNLSFCVATLLIEGDVFVQQFSEEAIRDPIRISLARKVQVIEDPEITRRGAKFRHMVRLTVRLKDGSEYSETMEAPRGSETQFPEQDIVIGKFEKLTRRSPDRARRIRELVLNLEQCGDATELARALSI
jgi:2-methylcitrate dehydratase PrpD